MISTHILYISLLISGYTNIAFCMSPPKDAPEILLQELKASIEQIQRQTKNFSEVDPAQLESISSQLQMLENKSRAVRNKLKNSDPWETNFSGK